MSLSMMTGRIPRRSKYIAVTAPAGPPPIMMTGCFFCAIRGFFYRNFSEWTTTRMNFVLRQGIWLDWTGLKTPRKIRFGGVLRRPLGPLTANSNDAQIAAAASHRLQDA